MWLDEATRRYFGQQFDQFGTLVLEEIPLPEGHFVDDSTALAFTRRDNGAVIALVSGNIQARSAPAVRVLENGPLLDADRVPWKVIAQANEFQVALELVGRRLGLDGTEPVPGHPEVAQEPALHDEPGVQQDAVVVPSGDGQPRSRRAAGSGKTVRRFCRDLSDLAARGQLQTVCGRDSELDRITQILLKASKNCPCLVGEPGVGKTAIVEALAQRIADGDVPARLQGLRLWEVDIPSLLGGASHKGAFEERVSKLLQEATGGNSDVILFVDELHLITQARGDVPLAEMLKPHLARNLRLIGATTHGDWKRYIEADQALTRRLQQVHIKEPGPEDTLAILRVRLPHLQAHHQVTVEDCLLKEIVALADAHLPERRRPDKALDLLDEAMAAQALEGTRNKETRRPPL